MDELYVRREGSLKSTKPPESVSGASSSTANAMIGTQDQMSERCLSRSVIENISGRKVAVPYNVIPVTKQQRVIHRVGGFSLQIVDTIVSKS